MTDVTIFEGPDGAGKTTLLEFMRDAVLVSRNDPLYPVRVVHLGPPEGDPRRELMNWIDYADAEDSPVLFDRFHLGEQVYGPIYRGKDGLGWIGRRAVEKALAGRRAVVVIAHPPYAVCRAAWARRKAAGGEMFPDPARHRRCWEAFLTVRTDLPVVMYDWTVAGKRETLEAIERARCAAYHGGRQ